MASGVEFTSTLHVHEAGVSYASEYGKVALIGQPLIPCNAFEPLAASVLQGKRPAHDLQMLPGAYTAVLEQGDSCIVDTDTAGQFPVYWKATPDHLALSTRSDILGKTPNAYFLGASIISCSELTAGQSAFDGVGVIEGGRKVHFGRSGITRIEDISVKNNPNCTLQEAADDLRKSFSEAIRLRIESGKIVTSDWSGGYDSTMAAIIAAGYLEDGLDTLIQYMPGTTFGDLRYARAAAEENPRIRLHEFPQDASLLPY